jgi:hypothetical protein
MSTPQAIVNLRPPSEAYSEATCSLVYRLSELMFGSLLAAYSLGFVGAIAAYGSQLSAHGVWGIVLLAAQYASISITFAYLTTSFYLTYHVGILTMPQLPFKRLGTDFTIAVVQAVFFGLSMLLPALFPVLLGINVLISSRRKDKEYERLALRLYNASWTEEGRDDYLPRFRQGLAKLMQSKDKFPELSDWAPTSLKIRIGAWTAIIIGLTVIYLCLRPELLTRVVALLNSLPFGSKWVENEWVLQQLLIAVEVICATVIITIRGSKVVGRRASFLGFSIKNPNFCAEQPNVKVKDQAKPCAKEPNEKPETQKRSPMDEEFIRLQLDLKTKCKEWFGVR